MNCSDRISKFSNFDAIFVVALHPEDVKKLKSRDYALIVEDNTPYTMDDGLEIESVNKLINENNIYETKYGACVCDAPGIGKNLAHELHCWRNLDMIIISTHPGVYITSQSEFITENGDMIMLLAIEKSVE